MRTHQRVAAPLTRSLTIVAAVAALAAPAAGGPSAALSPPGGGAAPVAAQPRVTAKVVVVVSDRTARVVSTIRAKKRVKAVRVMGKGVSLPLRRAGAKKWRSAKLTGAGAEAWEALAGRKVRVSMKVGGKKRVVRTRVVVRTVPADPGTTDPGTTDPGTGADPGTGTDPGASPPSGVFDAPGVERTGDEAWAAIQGYLADSRFTNCPAGWAQSGCASEERYSHWANGEWAYCRLTPVAGSDIRSYGDITQIIGAEQHADGSWLVQYSVDAYSTTTYYSWTVFADGSAVGQYWAPGYNPAGPPSEIITGVQWVRGALTCDQYTP